MRFLTLLKTLSWKRCSLKTKMALSVSAVFIVASTFRVFFTLGYLETESKRSIANQQHVLARSISDSLDDKLHTAQQALLAAGSEVIPAMLAHPQRAQLFLNDKHSLRPIFTDQLFLFDTKCSLVAQTPLEPDNLHLDSAFSELLEKTVRSRRPAISAPFRSRMADQQPVIVLTAPVFDGGGNLTGVLAGSLRLIGTSFLGDLPKMRVGERGYPFLVTTDGTVIVHPDSNRALKPLPRGVDKLLDRSLAGFEGSGDTVSPDGIPMLTSFSHLRSVDWVLGLNFPADEAYAVVYRTRHFLIGGIAAGTVVMLVLVWLLMQRLTLPLVAMARQVEAMDGGRVLRALEYEDSSYEIHTLTLAFNHLTETVRQQQETLEQNEKKYRIVADNAYDWEFWLSPEGCFIYSSPSGRRITGYEAVDFLSDPELLERIIHPDDRRMFLNYRDNAVATASVQEIECRIVRSDGEIRWVSHLCQPIYSDSETYLGLRGNNRDITVQKRIEAELQQSEERYRILVESSPDAVLLHRDGVFIYVNGAACRLFGAPHPELLAGMPVLDIIHPECREVVAGRIINAASADQATPCLEERVLRLDGTPIDVEAVRTHLMYQGRPAVQVILRDITARKQAEQALRESDAALRNLLEVMPVGVALLENDGSVQYVNRCFEEKFGYCHAEIPSLNEWYPAAYPDPAYRDKLTAEMDSTLAEARANGTPVAPVEVSITCKDGTVRRIILNRQITGQRRIVIFTDITERESLQNELLKAQKLESLGVLAGGIAHDFNNVLTGILGNLSFARMFVDETHSSFLPLKSAEKASLRAAELATQLLTFAKGGAPVKKIVSLPTLLEELVSLVLRGANVKATLRIADSLQAIEADEGQISQAFHNVILNAVQAMPNGGTLTVSAENVTLHPGSSKRLPPPGDYVMLSIADEGDGMPVEIHQKIFDPYFTTKPGGTGLGLASVHSIVSKHGGGIEVSSAPGKGTVFTFLLPSVPAIAAAPALSSEEPVAAAGLPGEAVLVMDDEPLILDLASQLLGHLGYRVTTCTNGEDAVSLYRQTKDAGGTFCAAIMDLTVPGGMGGKEAARLILALDPTARLIVSSGYSSDPVLAQYGRFGFCAAIAKPYKGHDLAQVLSALTRRLAAG